MIVDLLTYKELWNSNDQSHYEGLSKKTRNKLMKNQQKQDENKVYQSWLNIKKEYFTLFFLIDNTKILNFRLSQEAFETEICHKTKNL